MRTEPHWDRIALVTGAQGGLGTSVTAALLNAGLTVAGLARSVRCPDPPHPRFLGLSANVLEIGSTSAAIDRVIDSFGRIDVLVHLVGGFEGGTPVTETDISTLDRMLDLNLRSAFIVARAVVPYMRRAGFGRIVAIGSRTAVEPQAFLAAYGASKAALVALIRTLALENKDAGITANIVLPGTIDTAANRAAMPDADRSTWVAPDQIAKLILWLASDDSAQVSGARIPIYGKAL